MKRPTQILLVALICAWVVGCARGNPMRDVTEVIYTSGAGTILPELQWHEQISITRQAVTLTRNGRVAESRVNAGRWAFAADARAVDALFKQLAVVDCARLKRVEPADPPDGGDTVRYTVVYGRGKRCELVYDPGTTYTGGEAVVAPVAAFIRGLALPAGAGNRYK